MSLTTPSLLGCASSPIRDTKTGSWQLRIDHILSGAPKAMWLNVWVFAANEKVDTLFIHLEQKNQHKKNCQGVLTLRKEAES
ncbi:hypothetical protein N7454_003950 [Penicillium verhagenii]|nr:hypothetical protein N7454_003950 [Penicillium verhagenii]